MTTLAKDIAKEQSRKVGKSNRQDKTVST
jgi:hypothetical protein